MRGGLTCLAVVTVFAGGAAFASVAEPEHAPTHTGCLRLASGEVYNVAEGDEPAARCKADDTEITLGSGDITDVSPGTGLTGGGSEGEATIGLAPSFQLAQKCEDDAVSKWAEESAMWVCGEDVDTTYSAGEGLELDENYTFHVEQAPVPSLGQQLSTLWVAPMWSSYEQRYPAWTELFVLNLNGRAAGAGTLTASVWWMLESGAVHEIEELEIPGGTRVRLRPPFPWDRSGWLFVTASKPVLVGGTQQYFTDTGLPLHDESYGRAMLAYQMPLFPVSCADPAGLEFICERFGHRLEDAK